MSTTHHFLTALDRFCEDAGETLEAREARLNSRNAPLRETLLGFGANVLNRNIKLALVELDIEIDAFMPYLDNSGS